MRLIWDLPCEILDHIFVLTDVTTVLKNRRPWCLRYMPRSCQKELNWTHAAMKGNVTILQHLLANNVGAVNMPQLLDIALRNRRLEAAAFIHQHEGQIRNIICKNPKQRWKVAFFDDQTIVKLAVSRKVPELRWLLLETQARISCALLYHLLRLKSEDDRDQVLVDLLVKLKEEPKRVIKVNWTRYQVSHSNEMVNFALASLLNSKSSLEKAFAFRR